MNELSRVELAKYFVSKIPNSKSELWAGTVYVIKDGYDIINLYPNNILLEHYNPDIFRHFKYEDPEMIKEILRIINELT